MAAASQECLLFLEIGLGSRAGESFRQRHVRLLWRWPVDETIAHLSRLDLHRASGLAARNRVLRQVQLAREASQAAQQPGPPPARASWIGGQGTSPKEQKTQQSPLSGLRSAPQCPQS